MLETAEHLVKTSELFLLIHESVDKFDHRSPLILSCIISVTFCSYKCKFDILMGGVGFANH